MNQISLTTTLTTDTIIAGGRAVRSARRKHSDLDWHGITMSDNHFTASAASGKPAKPRPDFPLTPHPSGRWCKKIRGKLHYFGPWRHPDRALTKYLSQKDALHAGRKPRAESVGLTVKEVVNTFLANKQALVENGELSPRTWRDYKETTDLLVSHFGKHRPVADLAPDDFAALRKKMAKRWGLHRVAKNIQYTRSVFKHAFDAGLLDTPMRFGPGFERPSKKTFRLERARQGPKLFTRDEIHKLLGAAGTSMKAMILLAMNAGFGNGDCANLPLSAVDLEGGWIDFPRPKTGVPRRCPLWPETVAALRDVLGERPEPKEAEHAGLFFITSHRGSWGKETSDNPVSKETAKLLRELNIAGRKGLGFYTLRHIFRTVADEAKDQPAVDFMMGHESAHMSSHYRERINDERLTAVSHHVRTWLFNA
jgi:integrase